MDGRSAAGEAGFPKCMHCPCFSCIPLSSLSGSEEAALGHQVENFLWSQNTGLDVALRDAGSRCGGVGWIEDDRGLFQLQ